MSGVQRATDGVVRLPDLAPRVHRELLERVVRPAARQLVAVDLRVVGDDALDGIAQHDDQLHAAVHAVDALRHRIRGEVGGRLLHRNLVGEGVGHALAVPLQSVAVVVHVVEVMRLLPMRLDHRMHVHELEKRARPALPHADDQAARKVALRVLVADPVVVFRVVGQRARVCRRIATTPVGLL